MIRKYSLLIAVLLLATLQAQEVLPVSTDNILIFIEPFTDQGVDPSQTWLSQGLPGFLQSTLSETEHLQPYQIGTFNSDLIDRPHKLQSLIWKSVFHRRVDPAYETYLILGSFAYLEGQLTLRLDLLTLKNTHVLAHYENTFAYTKLLSWKTEPGEWVKTQLRLAQAPKMAGAPTLPALSDAVAPAPRGSLQDQLTTLFNTKQEQATADLSPEIKLQSRQKLGHQLESLWHDIAYDPYLAKIHDIHTLRLQYEPDSVRITFKVSYRINPRILDEIEYFSATRAGKQAQSASFEGHTFMDLGYIDADFTNELAGGDWRIVPIITMGPPAYPQRRVFYYSFPNPIDPPGTFYYNQGKFKQLLIAIPGVSALRIFAQEAQEDYEYSLTVGYDEIGQLDKIQVKFVHEQDLSDQLLLKH